MIPVVQSIVGNGKGGRPHGDCFRACVASIFELPLDAVPHFGATDPPSGWFTAVQEWLRPMGLVLDQRSHKEPSDSPKFWPPGWWIASVESENFPGSTHAVVMHGYYDQPLGEDWHIRVAHDPSPHPRRTPYVFRGAYWFVARDPALVVSRSSDRQK